MITINESFDVKYTMVKGMDTVAIIAQKSDVPYPLGTAECSQMDNLKYYFNRLYVHPKHRRQGIGKELLIRLLLEIKDKNKILELDINPYGDLNYEQLEKFYKEYGFVKRTVNDKALGTYDKFFFNAFISQEEPNA